jgi:hypothetical protein
LSSETDEEDRKREQRKRAIDYIDRLTKAKRGKDR